MSKKIKKYTASDKAKIALEALKGNMTYAEITSKYKVHSSQIQKWKNLLKDKIGIIFSEQQLKKDNEKDELIDELYKQIGQLKVEIDWLKKKSELFS
jgi:transposase-like protein